LPQAVLDTAGSELELVLSRAVDSHRHKPALGHSLSHWTVSVKNQYCYPNGANSLF